MPRPRYVSPSHVLHPASGRGQLVDDDATSPTYLLTGLFAAKRSGDDALVRLYLRRLADLGIRVAFGLSDLECALVESGERARAEGGAQ